MEISYYQIEIRRKEILYSTLRAHKKSKEPLELIVKADNKDFAAKALEKRGILTHYFNLVPYLSFKCAPDDASDIIEQVYSRKIRHNELKSISAVELSNKISIPSPKKVLAKAKKASYWHLEAIGAYRARSIADGRDAKIGVIDTGAEFLHDEIYSNFGDEKGYNFIGKNDHPEDDNGHGTHVSGLIAGKSCGIAINAELYALKVLDKNGLGSEADAMAAIEWAVLNNLNIVNMSFGASIASNAFQQMINAAAGKGLIMVAAAGNNGEYAPLYPAAFENVISVTAIDENLEHAYFSNIYPTNDISAPGVNVTSSFLDNSYATLDGTSMASPLVAGSLALIINSSDLEKILKETATPLYSNGDFEDYEVFGAGLLRADIMAENYSTSKFSQMLRFATREIEGINVVSWKKPLKKAKIAELLRRALW